MSATVTRRSRAVSAFGRAFPATQRCSCDILICSSITDNVNKLPRGDSEPIENGGAQSLVAANLIITDISAWQFCARDVDHAWQHAQPAELFLGRSGVALSRDQVASYEA